MIQSSTKPLGKFSLVSSWKDWQEVGSGLHLCLPSSAHCPGSLYCLFLNSFQPGGLLPVAELDGCSSLSKSQEWLCFSLLLWNIWGQVTETQGSHTEERTEPLSRHSPDPTSPGAHSGL